MKPVPFAMSGELRALMTACLEALPVPMRKGLLDSWALLATEVESHVRQTVFEEVRHQWADTLRIMLGVLP